MSLLEPLRADLRQCAACHDQCLFATVEVFARGSQSLATSRKAHALLRVIDGEISWSPHMVDVVYTALNTGIQHSVCVYKGRGGGWPDEATYIRAARQEITRASAEPTWAREMRDEWARSGDPYGVGAAETHAASVLLVVDAATRLYEPAWAATWAGLTDRLGVEAGWVAAGSSGFELFDLGYVVEAASAARQLHAQLTREQPETVVCDAPETVWMMTRVWPQWGLSMPAPVLHTSVWLEGALGGREARVGPTPEAVAFHDPSMLARGLGIIEEPRRVLAAVGVRLVEFNWSREAAMPAGSFYGSRVGPWVERLAAERRASASAVGATKIIVGSPFDQRDLSGDSIEVRGFLEEVLRNMERSQAVPGRPAGR